MFSLAGGTLFRPACSSMWFTNRFDIHMSSEFCNTGLNCWNCCADHLLSFAIFSWIVFSLKYILYGVNM